MDTTISRRAALARLAAIGITIPTLSAKSTDQAGATPVASPPASPDAATPSGASAPLTHRGINYDVGTEPAPGVTTRPDSDRAFLKPEFEAIRDELHCTTVGIFGDTVDRLVEGATAAIDTGLHARLQPRLINASIEDTLSTLADLGNAAEQLNTDGDETEIILDLGCELSLFAVGIIPGDTFDERLTYLLENLDQLPEFNDRLGTMLDDAITRARASFSGRLIYSSGSWEEVDWSGLDIVGVDLYRDEYNAATYVDTLRSYVQHGKPVWITEFGCCSYEGAEDLGGNAYNIIDWEAEPPQLNGDYTRSEAVQKAYILDLLDIFEQEGVEGAFVYQFIEPILPHTTEPQYDLDMAAYSVVKVYGPDSDHPYASTGYREPKEAFNALAERYASSNDQSVVP